MADKRFDVTENVPGRGAAEPVIKILRIHKKAKTGEREASGLKNQGKRILIIDETSKAENGYDVEKHDARGAALERGGERALGGGGRGGD